MNIFLYILAYALIAFGTWGRYYDNQSSADFIHTGQMEGNRLFRDHYGYLDQTKSWLFWGGILAMLAIGSIWQPLVGIIGGAAIGLFSYLTGKSNYKSAASNRIIQQRFFENLRAALDGHDDTAVLEVFAGITGIVMGGRTWLWPTGWLYSDIPDLNLALEQCRTLNIAWAKKDSSEWFKF